LGSKSYDRAEERRVELLLASGYNAIRCSHNPPAPAFLDACDRLGLLVIDEAFDCWEDGKNPQDYHLYFDAWWQRDLASMILRDRNHPSIILWSIGNEIPKKDSPRVASLAHRMADFVHALEPTRKVTAAVDQASVSKEPYIEALDVVGYNYGISWSDWYAEDHARHPDRVMFASESYPLEAHKYWQAVEDHPYVVGDFVWTAWDYIGESSIGWRGYPQEKSFFPWNLAFCGDIDVCGWKRPASYFRDALWHVGGDNISVFVEPPVPSFPVNTNRAFWSRWHWFDVVSNWNWTGHPSLKVDVYSTYPEAELFLNGRSLGRQPVRDNVSVWSVPYAAGTLKAVGYAKDQPGDTGVQPGKTAILQTAGQAVTIRATPDRRRLKADGEDLSYVTVELVDALGRRSPLADNLLHFSVQGPVAIAGVGNADPVSTESCARPERRCWQGRCLVILRTTRRAGVARLIISGAGLPSRSVTITSE
jgi:beta-galactosidase